ncbi:MAG: hypothetical protein U5K51_14330 [Flavobacteriaceae bacterium]|nr:hypothetical protein [Flavobacteriaceae bacterium]
MDTAEGPMLLKNFTGTFKQMVIRYMNGCQNPGITQVAVWLMSGVVEQAWIMMPRRPVGA